MWLWLLACQIPADAFLSTVPLLQADVDVVDFGAVGLDSSAQQSVTLTNVGGGSDALLVSADDARFVPSVPQASIGPQDTLDVVVTFNPTDGSDAHGTLWIQGSDQSFSVALSARTEPDADDDGFDHALLGGLDCDDQDASVHPDATEVWYDGVDQDCDQADDFDQDADGYDVDLDCDDTEPDAFPGNVEVWYDGVDGDCDGWSDFDQDHDGYDSDAHGGDDCDDTKPSVHPAGVDAPYDGVDGDCDGWSDYDADRDGHDDVRYGGDDCDDSDASRWSGCA
jgi:hypothetical protein